MRTPIASINLNSGWQFRTVTEDWRQATVPGCVNTDLRNLEAIPDPFYGRNKDALKWIEEREWDYQLIFSSESEFLAQDHVELVCEGLDTRVITGR